MTISTLTPNLYSSLLNNGDKGSGKATQGASDPLFSAPPTSDQKSSTELDALQKELVTLSAAARGQSTNDAAPTTYTVQQLLRQLQTNLNRGDPLLQSISSQPLGSGSSADPAQAAATASTTGSAASGTTDPIASIQDLADAAKKNPEALAQRLKNNPSLVGNLIQTELENGLRAMLS